MESAESAPSTKAVKKPRVQWTEKATWALIKSWEDNLDALRGQKHNGVVYQRIAESLTDAGIPRTRAQVHAKIDNLTQTYLAANMFGNSRIRSHLAQLQRGSRVNHYGVLDIYGSRDEVGNVSASSVPVALTAMRQLLGNNTWVRKVFVGVGYYYYNDSDAWDKLSYAAETVASKDVDMLVIINTVLSIPYKDQCITLPVNAHKSPNKYAPTMACQPTKSELNLEKSNIAFNSEASSSLLGKTILHSFDTFAQMKEKAMLIMETPGRRANFTWFLYNVELTDVTRQCLPGGPFDRLKEFKNFYVSVASQSPTG
ncbi:hypothetical protein HPB52_013826 [Rhipicephalus sanguineus]|uniref:Myb/SANT-like DNA-binding domain-containing protein n=1 Tax=Rhipicephalus sanguineus TaxID=34632 RepID=A0A9D4QD91_RHISA|nr:hypothetical protein HPB52_013826 [Rhipicephalus sanguineus]